MNADLLNLKSLRVLSCEDLDNHYRIKAEATKGPTQCSACLSYEFYGHGSQPQAYMDTPIHGKKVVIEIDRRRSRCKRCGKTVFEPVPDLDNKRLATCRLIEYIEKRCLSDTFMAVAREVGVDNKTVRNIFDDYVERKKKEVKFQTPEVLGIDEIKIIGAFRATLTNIDQLSFFDLLQTRKRAHLLDYFDNLDDKHRVKVLVMDMWRPYRFIGERIFPGKLIVVDKFHVVRMANYALETIRKRVRHELDRGERLKLRDDRFVLLQRAHRATPSDQAIMEDWFAQFPVLGMAYDAKEAFYQIYEQPNRQKAEAEARKWVNRLDPSIAKPFRVVTTALGNWWAEIFNYYDYPVTNAYTESINGVVRNLQRISRGYSFEVVRAKLLYNDKAVSNASTSVRRRVQPTKAKRPDTAMGMYTGHRPSGSGFVQETTNYGAHIPTLVDLLEEGYFS